VVDGQEKLLLQKLWCWLPDDTAPSATGTSTPTAAAASTATSPTNAAYEATATQLCDWCTRLVGNGQEGVVLFASSHRMPDNSCTPAPGANHQAAAATATASSNPSCTATANACGDNILPL